MKDLTAEELKILNLYSNRGPKLWAAPPKVDEKLLELGYVEQKLGGLGITDKGMRRLMRR
jgi:hypothetical protein